MTVTSGAGTDSLFEATGPLFKIGVAGTTRITLNDTTSQVEITFADLAMLGNDIILDADGDSKFDLGVDDVLILNLAGTPEFVWSDTSFDISDKFQQFTQIVTPSVPSTTSGRLYAKATLGTTHPFWLENDGTETDLTLGSAGAGGGGGLTFANVVKSLGESVTSSTVFQQDNELTFVTEANTVHAFKMALFLTHGGGEFKFRWTLPSGATGTVSIDNITSFSATATQDITVEHIVISPGTFTTNIVVFEGRIVTGSEGGPANLEWAQNVSDASPSTVLQGSYLRVYSDSTTTTTGVVGAIFAKIVKTADQTVNNTTTVVEDTELRFVGTANKVYSYLLWLYWESDNNNIALRRSWTLPSGATGGISGFELAGQDGVGLDDMTDEREITRTEAGELYSSFQGKVVMGGVTGSVIFNFAQFVADAGDTTVLRGSTLIVYEEGSQGDGVTPAAEIGFEVLTFTDRDTFSSSGDIDNANFLKKWEITPPVGLSDFNFFGEIDVSFVFQLRRVSGSGTARAGWLRSEDNIFWENIEIDTTTSATFQPEAVGGASGTTRPEIRFIAFAVFTAGASTTAEIKEINATMHLLMGPGYTLAVI